MEKRNSPDWNLLVNVMTKTSSSASSIKRASLLKQVTYDLKLSSSSCLMFNKLAKDLLYLYPLMKWVMKCPLNSLKVVTMLRAILLSHTLTGPLRVVGNALHMISFGTPCKCIRVLNDFRWSSESRDPSYASTNDIWKLARRGKKVTYTMKGESVRCSSSSRSMETCPLMVFIIMFIFSFIICMSYTMHIALLSSSDKWSVLFNPSRLLGILLSS